jgi:hypothetical protein
MMIRVGDTILDGNVSPVIEKRWKLFEEVDSVSGDMVYNFVIPRTSKNDHTLKLSNFLNRSDKTVYNLPSRIQNESGQDILIGSLTIIDFNALEINASFISGNSTWINSISGNVSDLDLWEYGEVPANTLDNTEGLIYININKGTLGLKIWPQFHGGDSMPTAYVKTILKEIFSEIGVKISGELISEWVYQHMVIGSSGRSGSSNALIARESKAGISSPQAISTTPVVVAFDDVTNFPFFDGSENLFDVVNYRYVTNPGSYVDIEINLQLDSSVLWIVEVRRNGAPDLTRTDTSDNINILFSKYQPVSSPYMGLSNTGDYIDVVVYTAVGTSNIESGYIHVIPKYFELWYPQFLFGDMTKRTFITNIFKIFNVVPVYDDITKTITLNLFSKIKSHENIDLSNQLASVRTIDTISVLENYGASTFLRYQQDQNEDINLYNDRVQKKFGDGEIVINNSSIESTSSVEVDFTSSISQYAEAFGAYFPKIDLYSMAEGPEVEYTSVSDDGFGFALFNTSGNHNFSVSDTVRIKTSNTGRYLGIGIVRSTPSATSFTLQLTSDIGTAAGIAVSIDVSESESDSLFAFIVVPSIPISTFTNVTTFYAGVSPITSIPYAWFIKPFADLPIDEYKHQLGFESPNIKMFGGLFIKDTYYREVELMVNDPVLVLGDFNISQGVYNNLNSAKPVRLRTKEFDGLFYLNRITGYQNSSLSCEVELIKLS